MYTSITTEAHTFTCSRSMCFGMQPCLDWRDLGPHSAPLTVSSDTSVWFRAEQPSRSPKTVTGPHTHVWDKNSLYTSIPKNWHLLSQNCVEASGVCCDDSYLPRYTHAIPCASLQTLTLSLPRSSQTNESGVDLAVYSGSGGLISCDCYNVPFFCILLYPPNSEGLFQHQQHLTGVQQRFSQSPNVTTQQSTRREITDTTAEGTTTRPSEILYLLDYKETSIWKHKKTYLRVNFGHISSQRIE